MEFNTPSPCEIVVGPDNEPLFTNFSAQYYVGKLYISETNKDTAVVPLELLTAINKQLYSDNPILDYSLPLVFKIDEKHITTIGDNNIPIHTIQLPQQLLTQLSITMVPTLKEVLLLKPN